MDSSELIPVRARTVDDDWRELATRAGDGLGISLLWSRSADCVKITVFDQRLDESFDVEIDSTVALSAFQHPFAHARSHAVTAYYAERHPLTLRQQA